jgi:uncharacterized membrane protein HdeD (DUF308 family)
MLQRFFAIAAWTALCLVAYVTLSPIGQRPTLLASWNIEHLAVFAVLGGLFCLAYPRSTRAVLIIVLGGAALLEILQLFTPDRHARTLDALQKIAGGCVGIFAGRAILHFDRVRSRFPELIRSTGIKLDGITVGVPSSEEPPSRTGGFNRPLP